MAKRVIYNRFDIKLMAFISIKKFSRYSVTILATDDPRLVQKGGINIIQECEDFRRFKSIRRPASVSYRLNEPSK